MKHDVKFKDMTGLRVGRLIVQRFSHFDSRMSQSVWMCRCDCGAMCAAGGKLLRSGAKKSCGCLRRDGAAALKRSHGMRYHRDYQLWKGMKSRCHNKKLGSYKNYGGRGIRVCRRWRESFAAFVADMGPRPSSKHTIDRKRVNGNYCPSNCRWATHLEQAQNKTNTKKYRYQGRSRTLRDWCREFGAKATIVALRLGRGWSIGDALTRPKGYTLKTGHVRQYSHW